MRSGANGFQLILLALGIAVAFYWIQVARRRRDLVRYRLRLLGVYVCGVIIGTVLLLKDGHNWNESVLFSIFIGSSAALILVRRPKANRRIPRRVRRAVIAKYEAGGKRFNPKLHDIDHLVPYSKGGDHSLANLRVMERSANRRRGAKMPKFWDFIR